jgi:CubicO group peptidase (beta-lactamase class C family)
MVGPALAGGGPGRLRSNRDWMAAFAALPLDFPPGSRSRYCNACYVVLGEVIASASGLSYEEYIAQRIFAAAGMGGAGFFASDEPIPRVAEGYTRQPAPGQATPLRASILGRGARGSAAGGSYATAADLLAFDEALREHRLLDREQTAWFFGAAEPATGRARAHYGIAGGSPGTSTVLESDGTWTVVVLANLDPQAGEDLGTALFRALAR